MLMARASALPLLAALFASPAAHLMLLLPGTVHAKDCSGTAFDTHGLNFAAVHAPDGGACQEAGENVSCEVVCRDGFSGGSAFCNALTGFVVAAPCTADDCSLDSTFTVVGHNFLHVEAPAGGQCQTALGDEACIVTCRQGFLGGRAVCNAATGNIDVEPCTPIASHCAADDLSTGAVQNNLMRTVGGVPAAEVGPATCDATPAQGLCAHECVEGYHLGGIRCLASGQFVLTACEKAPDPITEMDYAMLTVAVLIFVLGLCCTACALASDPKDWSFDRALDLFLPDAYGEPQPGRSGRGVGSAGVGPDGGAGAREGTVRAVGPRRSPPRAKRPSGGMHGRTTELRPVSRKDSRMIPALHCDVHTRRGIIELVGRIANTPAFYPEWVDEIFERLNERPATGTIEERKNACIQMLLHRRSSLLPETGSFAFPNAATPRVSQRAGSVDIGDGLSAAEDARPPGGGSRPGGGGDARGGVIGFNTNRGRAGEDVEGEWGGRRPCASVFCSSGLCCMLLLMVVGGAIDASAVGMGRMSNAAIALIFVVAGPAFALLLWALVFLFCTSLGHAWLRDARDAACGGERVERVDDETKLDGASPPASTCPALGSMAGGARSLFCPCLDAGEGASRGGAEGGRVGTVGFGAPPGAGRRRRVAAARAAGLGGRGPRGRRGHADVRRVHRPALNVRSGGSAAAQRRGGAARALGVGPRIATYTPRCERGGDPTSLGHVSSAALAERGPAAAAPPSRPHPTPASRALPRRARPDAQGPASKGPFSRDPLSSRAAAAALRKARTRSRRPCRTCSGTRPSAASARAGSTRAHP
jgi:hypothetical protein